MPFEPFTAGEHKRESGFDLLPVDKYNLAITKTEMKPTSSGGEMLNLESTVQDGKFAGRVIFSTLFMVAPPNATEGQQKAVRIAKWTLDTILTACGIAALTESYDDLLALPFVGQVEVESGKPKDKNNPDGEKYADRNVIKKFFPRTASAPVSEAAPW